MRSMMMMRRMSRHEPASTRPGTDVSLLCDLKCLWLCAVLFGCPGGEEASEQAGSSSEDSTSMEAGTSRGSVESGDAGGAPPFDAGDDVTPATAGAGAAGRGMLFDGGTSGSAAPPARAGTSGSIVPDAAAAGTGSAADGGGDAGMTMAGTGSTSAPSTYPALAADAIGRPVQIASGFKLAESPLWDPCSHSLLFADVIGGSGGGVIHALGADGKSSVVMTDTGNTNGFTYDVDGSWIMAQMTGHIARRDATGEIKTLEAAGSRLHTPDDVVVRSDGTIYFSDGDFCPVGTLLGYGSTLPVFMVKPGASELIRLGTVSGPNGIELSPDEKILYVNGFGDGTIWAFDVAEDGSAKKRARPLVSGLTNPDSTCLDAAGNLYVGVSAGLQVLRPDGTKVKLIPINAPAGTCTTAGVTNCTFGGDDGKTLYLTTWTTIWKIDNMPIPGLDWIVGQQRAKCD
jgi:gluconolactonase